MFWVAHRRMGKDKPIFANIAKKMMERRGTYYYFLDISENNMLQNPPHLYTEEEKHFHLSENFTIFDENTGQEISSNKLIFKYLELNIINQ